MGTIYLVRHAQAAYGTDDYDRLTQTGFTQAQLLGTYFGFRQIRFDAVYMGELRRHAETAQGILEAYPYASGVPSPERFPALNEYRGEALVAAFTGSAPTSDPAAALRDPLIVRERFRVLKQALLAWTEDRILPAGVPLWQTFQDAAVATVVEARHRFPAGNVLLISSGGPIAAVVAAALNAPAQTAIELNLRMRNSSVTEFTSSARRHSLICFNALPHLDMHPDSTLATYT
jgi:broad specificity phosphatase PhoE